MCDNSGVDVVVRYICIVHVNMDDIPGNMLRDHWDMIYGYMEN